MAFSEYTKDIVFRESGGSCECRRLSHRHPWGRCRTTIWRHRNIHFHHINAYGDDTSSNCEALCIKCHKLTRSYGRQKY